MNRTKEVAFVEFLGCGVATFYNWKKEADRPMLDMLFKYFDKEGLSEYLDTGEIRGLKLFMEYKEMQEELNDIVKQVVNSIQSQKDISNMSVFSSYLANVGEVTLQSWNSFFRSLMRTEDETMVEALFSVQETILGLDRNTLLRFEELAVQDFKDLIGISSKKELKDFVLPFVVAFVSEKYSIEKVVLNSVLSADTIREIELGELIDSLPKIVSAEDVVAEAKERNAKNREKNKKGGKVENPIRNG